MNSSTPLQKTPLSALHHQLGAKVVAFAGYEMPLQYLHGILHEHLHTRAQAGFFDISHMGQLLLSGKAAAEQLECLTPSAIATLQRGQQRYTVLTNDSGGVIDDIIITRLNDEQFFIVVNAACKDKDFLHLQHHLAPSCSLQALNDRALLALQGPAAANVIERHCADASALSFMHACETSINGINCIISRSGYTGEDGFEISLPADTAEIVARLLLSEPRVQPAGLGSRDTLRLEAGLCLYGHELNDTITPVEAGLKWIIDKHNDRYPGATIVQQQLQHGPNRRRVGLLPASKAPIRDGAVLKNRQGENVGIVTSGGYSPSLERPIAMGLVASEETQIGNTLITIRNSREVELTIAALPFVPHRYRHKS